MDKSFQYLVCGMQMAKNSRGNAYMSTFLDFSEKQTGKVYSLIFELFKETKSQNKIYLNSKKSNSSF